MDDVSRQTPAQADAARENGKAADLVARAVQFAITDRAILNGIDLAVAPGEKIAVIGPNGSGKSTFLRCLYAWHRPTGGAILLDGAALSDVSSSAF